MRRFFVFMAMSFAVTILGSSGAMPAYGRYPTSQLVEIQNEFFLVDCGEGAQMQLLRFKQNLHRINHIFISHLHGDHYLGLLGLLFTMHLNRRTNDLHIYGPKGLDEIITVQFKHSNSVPYYDLIFHCTDTKSQQIIFENKQLTVETIPLQHKINCCGFLFREKPKQRRIDKTQLPEGLSLQQLGALKRGEDIRNESGVILYKNNQLTLPPRHARSYAYCSDTAYHEPLTEQLEAIDLLYHEATFMQQDYLKAVETKHSTAEEAASIAKKAGVKKLLIGHFSARYRELDALLAEAQTIFPNTGLAIEGETYSIQE